MVLHPLKEEIKPIAKAKGISSLKAECMQDRLGQKIYVQVNRNWTKRKVYQDCIDDLYILVRKERFYEHEFEKTIADIEEGK